MFSMPHLATAFAQGQGISWWQSLGGLLAVFALLIVFLKVLGRINRGMRGEEAGLEKVWSLGPRREIQVLRLGDEVHFIYRHDGAMVLLKRQSHAEFQQENPSGDNEGDSEGWKRFLPGNFEFRPQDR